MKALEIDDSTRDEIYNKYKSGVPLRKIEREYPYSFTFIQKLVMSFEWSDKIKENYPQKDGYDMIAVCKLSDKEFKDYSNESGAITKHINQQFPNLPQTSKYLKKSIEYSSGKFWYDEFFIFKYKRHSTIIKCNYCDWTTEDVNNLSGAYEKHLINIHKISVDNHIKDHPNDIKYFKKPVNLKDGVTCKICGEKLKMINNTHLKKHGISVIDYKIKYGIGMMVSNSTIKKLHECWENGLKNQGFKKQSSYEKEIIRLIPEIKFIESDRKILNGLEIDLYDPNTRIGIEVNGVYYHSEICGGKNRTYHANKLNIANSKNIQLIQIFEDEIKLKQDLIILKLKHILGISNAENIHARKCRLCVINDKDIIKSFLNNYHIQGHVNSTHNVGAYFNEELIGVMSFNNKRNMNRTKIHDDKTFDLVRFAINNKYISNGLGNRLLKYFISQYNPSKIISFADRRWTINMKNNLYTKLGFELTKTIPPDYTYFNPKIMRYGRLHKFGFGKGSLKKRFPEIYDENKTEWQMMQELGYDRIWDCGKFRYELNIV